MNAPPEITITPIRVADLLAERERKAMATPRGLRARAVE
jgi:hypothetical protein